MRHAYDVATIRAAESALMAQLPEGALMLRAATGLARTCAVVLGSTYGARVALLVGSGDNGGDALHAGALLAGRGAQVAAVLLADRVHEAGLAALHRAGGSALTADSPDADAVVAGADLVVDGIVGIGGAGGLRPRAAALAEVATGCDAVVVAVDLPSGVAADTGAVPGEAVWADVTVTFGALKPGLVVAPGALRAGTVEVVDIGLAPYLPRHGLAVLDAPDVAHLLPVPGPADHKYSQGVTGVAAGSSRFPGAAVLTTAGALRTKAGLVRYAGAVADAVVAAHPSVVVSPGPPSQAGRVQAWAVGPGLGTDVEAAGVVADVLRQPVPAVVDADGLTVLTGLVDDDPQLLTGRAAATVLTPHGREFARLAPDLARAVTDDADADLVGATRTLADRLDCVVLLKGTTTVVAAPGGEAYVNPTGTPWLASGGTGDVLTGVVAALLAAGVPAPVGTAAAAYLHGLAGRLAADGAPLTADQVAAALPDARRAVAAAAAGEPTPG